MRGEFTVPPYRRWGGGPCEAWWRGDLLRPMMVRARAANARANYPSTTLRVVPLPPLRAGRH
jgi:hypothetical protein